MTKAYVRWFEKEQEQYGTQVALSNLLIDLGFELIKKADPAITGISLRRARTAKPRSKPKR